MMLNVALQFLLILGKITPVLFSFGSGVLKLIICTEKFRLEGTSGGHLVQPAAQSMLN